MIVYLPCSSDVDAPSVGVLLLMGERFCRWAVSLSGVLLLLAESITVDAVDAFESASVVLSSGSLEVSKVTRLFFPWTLCGVGP